ncbi:hypothetical protein [Micromonospora psammae]|uniref:hypothetical protein n=1 Tax=Micromonospora sp. CPCC 205556 TaxID=3122398 RepID=UPI002FF179B4
MNGWEILASFIFGLLVNEMTDVSPWAARKLVRWAAYRWTPDADIAAGYAEEWSAIIDERPGKLLKLITAVQFTVGAVGRAAPRMLLDARRRTKLSVRDSRVGDAISDIAAGTGLGLAALSWSGPPATVGTVALVVSGGVTLMAGLRFAVTASIRRSCRAAVRPKRRY